MSEHGTITTAPPRALAYLRPRAASFWRWSDDGRTIVWADGQTIAFRQEAQAVLARLARGGLPPFGAVVLLLASTRDTWGDGAAKADLILLHERRKVGGDASARSPGAGVVLSFLMPHMLQQEIRDICDELSAVAALPPDLRQTLRARCALAEFVFEGAPHRGSFEEANEVIDLLTGGIDPDALRQATTESNDDRALLDEIVSLRAGLSRVAVEPVTAFMRTGVDAGVRAPDLEIPAAPRVRALLGDLRGDPELAGIAKLAQDLLAALHVPRALVWPEEIPVGGVSDISNRGPLDRLLISELAHDDLTLAVRVALNEALYLRRESPAQHPPFARSILVDSGIRLWGVPRLFAAGVALALAASADPRAPVNVFRASGFTVEPIDLTTREGLTTHLEALEPHPHPGQSLHAWVDAIESAEGGESPASETFIVTHADALADPDFALALRAVGIEREWKVATVARDGTFALWNVSREGRRQLCGATLGLDDVLNERHPAAAAMPLVSPHADLPAILFAQPFPLLLPARVEPRYATYEQQIGLVGVTHDRRLMRWTSSVKGAEQLAAALPPGPIHGPFVDYEPTVVHVVVAAQRRNAIHIVTAHLNDGRVETRTYPRNHPRHVFFHRGLVGLAYVHELRMIDPLTGAETVITMPPQARWLNGRFFSTPDGVSAASAASVDLVCNYMCASAFDVAGEGPWALHLSGQLGPVDRSAARPAPGELEIHDCQLRGVSADGRRLLVRALSTKNRQSGFYAVDIPKLDKPTWTKLEIHERDQRAALLGEALELSHSTSMNVRWRFSGVAIGHDGIVALTDGNHVHEFRLRKDNLYLAHAPDVAWRASGEWSRPPSFERIVAPDGARYHLRVARWSDGSRAFLDSRGMLHLISSDKRLPQLTVTLTDRAAAGWTSNGQTFGWAHFLKQPPTADAAYALNVLREFTRRLQ